MRYSARRRPRLGIQLEANRPADTVSANEEIAETLGVAIAVNAGAALVFSARVMDVLTEPPAE